MQGPVRAGDYLLDMRPLLSPAIPWSYVLSYPSEHHLGEDLGKESGRLSFYEKGVKQLTLERFKSEENIIL